MYGIIGKIIAVEGERDSLISILIKGTKGMPGCISYVISKDTQDPNGIWVTELWKDQASHQNSMTLPGVQEAMMTGKPLIHEFEERHVVQPVGGQGI